MVTLICRRLCILELVGKDEFQPVGVDGKFRTEG